MNKLSSIKSVSVSHDPVYCSSPQNRREYHRRSCSLFTAACPNGETWTFHFSQLLLRHANRKASVGAAQGPHRSFCCRMFGDVPPARISAAVLLINYSWNTGHPASQPRFFSLFSFFFSSACSPCSACLHLADSRQKPGEQFVTEYSPLLLSVWGFPPFALQHLLRSSRSPAAAPECLTFSAALPLP